MSISDLLSTSSGKTFKFDQPGATVGGPVTSAEIVQKRNFDTNEPEFWSDEKPVQQIRVLVQTELRDQPDETGVDDGIRAVYIKGWGDQLRTLRAAIQAAGAKDIEVGGTFTATYVRDGELPAGKRGFPPKVYAYTYQPPSRTGGLLSTPQGQVDANTCEIQQQPQAAAPAPAPAPSSGPTAEQVAAVKAAGLDPATVFPGYAG
jgi:hypothetical protein